RNALKLYICQSIILVCETYSLNLHYVGIYVLFRGQRKGCRDALHAGSNCQAPHQPLKETFLLYVSVVPCSRSREPESQQVGWSKSRIDAVQARDAREKK